MIIYLILYVIFMIPGMILFFENPLWISLIPFGIWCYLSYKAAYLITRKCTKSRKK